MKSVAEVAELDGLDLTAAIQILEQAGRYDRIRQVSDPLARLQALIDELCNLSMHDGLTGLVNPTFFRAALESELDRMSRTGRNCTLMLLDIDDFKFFNDTYGHHAGDQVLRTVATKLRDSLRSMDMAARMGGDEFAVMLPECAAENAIRAARRIHHNVCPFECTIGDRTLGITTSAGLTWTEPGVAISPKMILAQADAELYRAKRAGRKQLSYARPVPTRVSAAEHAALVALGIKEDFYEQ